MLTRSMARDGALRSPDDASLVEAARHDLTAFAQLYQRYVTPVYRYLYSRVGDTAEAEDLTSQVFAEALEGLARCRERQRFAAWLFAIARHRAVDHYRRRRVLAPLAEEMVSPPERTDPLSRVVQKEALEQLRTLVRRLDEEQQELLRLRFAAGLSHEEIATVLGRSKPAVKMAVHRLLRRLQAAWEDWEDSDE